MPGIVTAGVPTTVVKRKVYPAPKCKGSNSTSTQLHNDKNSIRDNKSLLSAEDSSGDDTI